MDITEEDYYQRLDTIWDLYINNEYGAKEWLREYDYCFKLCLDNKEEIIYNAMAKLFRAKALTSDKDNYFKGVQNMVRMAAYIHRFWVPYNKKTPLFDLATEIWSINYQ